MMHPLILTIAFLTLIATLVTTEVKSFVEKSGCERLYNHYVQRKEIASLEGAGSLMEAIRALDPPPTDEKEKKVPDPSPTKPRIPKCASLDFDLACPPNNARLNFCHLLHSPARGEGSFYQIGVSLLHNLYGSSSYFRSNPRLATALLEALIAHKEETRDFHFPDELASVDLEDERLQIPFNTLLRGGIDDEGRRIPPLTDYISFYKGAGSDKINLMFASEELLTAIFGNAKAVQSIVKDRKHLLTLFIDQEAHRHERLKGEGYSRGEATELVRGLLIGKEERVQGIFDCTLGHPGTYLMITDPHTFLPIREKLPPVGS